MKIKIILMLNLIMVSIGVLAQNNDKLHALKLKSVGIQLHQSLIIERPWESDPGFLFADLYSLPIENYNYFYAGIFQSEPIDFGFKGFANFEILNKKNNSYTSNRELQFGLSYNYSDRYNIFFVNNNHLEIDTIDNTPGHLVLFDSSTYYDKAFYFDYEQIGFNMAYSYFTKPIDGLSLYVMPGIDINFTIINQCDYTQTVPSGEIIAYHPEVNSNGDTTRIRYQFGSKFINSSLDIPGSLFLRPSVAFGINYQLPIIHKINLFFGIKTGLDFHFSKFRLINQSPFNSMVMGIIYKI